MNQAISSLLQIRSALRALLLAGFATMLLSCAPVVTQPVSLPELFYPSPPDAPRFVFERTVQGSADLIKGEESRARRLLTGEALTTVPFTKPFDVTSCQGTMFVSDTVKRVVLAFDATRKNFYLVGSKDPGKLAKPLGVDTDGNCRLYVADASRSVIAVYEKDGTFVKAIGGADYFDRLSYVAVNAAGTKIFAVDTGGVSSENHRIRVFDTDSGNLLYDIGTRGREPGQFNLPMGISISADGSIFIVDAGNFRIQILTEQGEFLSQFGSNGRQLGEFARPKGIAVDQDNNSYVSDASHGNFQIFSPEGELLLFVGTRAEANARASYMLPAGLDVDDDGRVYMVDQFFAKVEIYRPASLTKTEGYLGSWDVATSAVPDE